MIVSKTLEQRKAALAKLLPMQRGDFEGNLPAQWSGHAGYHPSAWIRRSMSSCPHEDDEIKELADEMGVSFDELKGKVESLHEFNPMLGTPRLPSGRSLSGDRRDADPSGYRYAAINVRKEAGLHITPEIMIPLVSARSNELNFVKKIVIKATADELIEAVRPEDEVYGRHDDRDRRVPQSPQTMMAKEAEFFSFGTNDLTQMTYGFSRDDAGRIPGDLLRQEDLRVRSVRSSGPERRRPA